MSNDEYGPKTCVTPSWWLSFVDGDRPKDEQFLGVCVVTAPDFGTAVQRAHLLGCNPGGEVQGVEIPMDTAPFIEDKWRRRVLTREECAEFDKHVQAVCPHAARRAREVSP